MAMKTAAMAALIGVLAGTALFGTGAEAGTLENLERERAHLIQLIADPSVAPGDRQVRIASAARRLRDLERMVMRDQSLVGRNTPAVKTAFDNYDLTFLVHAAAEDGVSLAQKWFAEVGLASADILASRPGSR